MCGRKEVVLRMIRPVGLSKHTQRLKLVHLVHLQLLFQVENKQLLLGVRYNFPSALCISANCCLNFGRIGEFLTKTKKVAIQSASGIKKSATLNLPEGSLIHYATPNDVAWAEFRPKILRVVFTGTMASRKVTATVFVPTGKPSLGERMVRQTNSEAPVSSQGMMILQVVF